jgi:hypothetical protein
MLIEKLRFRLQIAILEDRIEIHRGIGIKMEEEEEAEVIIITEVKEESEEIEEIEEGEGIEEIEEVEDKVEGIEIINKVEEEEIAKAMDKTKRSHMLIRTQVKLHLIKFKSNKRLSNKRKVLFY